MSEQTAEALRSWFRRVEPYYPELFNTAHVICGSYETAENALGSALLDVWSGSGDGGMGLREKLRAAIREESLRLCRADDGVSEFTWTGFTEIDDDPIAAIAQREDVETQRLLMLRHGVGLSPGRIAAVTGLPGSLVRSTLNRFESRSKRRLPARERGHYDALLTKSVRRQLASRTGIPHPATVYRAFEAEASNLEPPQRLLSRMIYHALVLIMALVCAALFWLFAVLVQPPDMQSPQAVPVQTASPGTHIETTFENEAPA